MNYSMVPTFAAENNTATLTNQTKQTVNISDANKKSELNFRLGHASDSPITADELAPIKKLNIRKNIASIEGLQYCVNLQTLVLGNNSLMEEELNTISDLSPLKNLKKLTYLTFGGLKITDFSLLKDLPLKADPTQFGIWVTENLGELKVTHQADGTVVCKNPFVNVNGEAMIPADLCGGTYNKTEITITWSKEAFKEHVTFSQDKTDYLNLNIVSDQQATFDFNGIGTWSGKDTHFAQLKYNGDHTATLKEGIEMYGGQVHPYFKDVYALILAKDQNGNLLLTK
ncbi:hypothetical protein [Enterococcus faecalis]|uniref:hypothetical protein n=1 Tax=Enterococcus faecalis TaxID=1351 RepID=UPI0011B1C9B5|nr:hypothetical protein [Enterococcus faecalis]